MAETIGVQTAAGSAQSSVAGKRGCHAWAPVFRPVLGILGAGKVLVALPTHVPYFGTRVYAHANVLNPPLTFDVVLSTKPGHGWPVPTGTIRLAVHGTAGQLPPLPGASIRMVSGKMLNLPPVASAVRSVLWHDQADNITYTVTLRARLGLAALLRIAGTLTPGTLRRTPITRTLKFFNACP